MQKTQKKEAFWRGKATDSQTTRYALWDLATNKELKQFGGYSSWNNAKAEEAAVPYASHIEQKARAAGYTIIDNPID